MSLEGCEALRATGAASTVPLGAVGPLQAVSTDAVGSNPVSAERIMAGARFFDTLGVAIVPAGISVTSKWRRQPAVAIVNETLARRLFPKAAAVGASLNAFRKFTEMRRFLLYSPREPCTYTGDAELFPDPQASGASAGSTEGVAAGSPRWFPECLGQLRPRGGGAHASPPGTETPRPDRPIGASADVSCHARRRHLGRTLLRVVSGTPRQQFVVRSAPPLALGGLYRPDAAGAAADGDSPPAAGSVLARLAPPRSTARNTV